MLRIYFYLLGAKAKHSSKRTVMGLLGACFFSIISMSVLAQTSIIYAEAEDAVKRNPSSTYYQIDTDGFITWQEALVTDIDKPDDAILDFKPNFTETGTDWHVYIRIQAVSATQGESFFTTNTFGEATGSALQNLIVNTNYGYTEGRVDGVGEVGGGVWKWIDLSDRFDFTLTVNETGEQTYSLASREAGLKIDKIAFGPADLTVEELDAPDIARRENNVFLEAEAATSLGAPSSFTNTTEDGFGVFEVTTDLVSGDQPGASTHVLSYSVTFPQPGDFTLLARIKVPSTNGGAGSNDSFYVPSSFGIKDPMASSDWITINGLNSVGFSAPTDMVSGSGSAGADEWKWVDLSSLGAGQFIVPEGALTQDFYIGSREDGLKIDAFAFFGAGNVFSVQGINSLLFDGRISYANTTLFANPNSIVPNGTSSTTITISLKDDINNQITSSQGVVTVSTDLGVLGSVTDNNDGTYSVVLTSSTTEGVANVTGQLNGLALTDTAKVRFERTEMRGRPRMENGTLVTDRGTLLRGAYSNSGHFDQPEISRPSLDKLIFMKNHGLNTIHHYGEDITLPVGTNVERIDQIVDWAAEEGLYVVLVFGGPSAFMNFPAQEVIDWSAAVWEFYATRYKDKTHVIFEIHNEPEFYAPFSQHVIDMMNNTYSVIRSVAPESHIMMMSYSEADFAEEIVNDLNKLTAVDWSNASLAFHTYKTSPEDLRDFMTTIRDAGYNITCTETEGLANHRINLGATRIFEEEFVSNLHFIQWRLLELEPDWYINRVERSRFRWETDFGTWPNDIPVPEDGRLNPFDDINPSTGTIGIAGGDYDDGKGWHHRHAVWSIFDFSDGDYVGYYDVNFDQLPTKFHLVTSANRPSSFIGKIKVVLDSINGEQIAETTIFGTGSEENVFEFTTDVTVTEDIIKGIHDLYFVMESDRSNFSTFIQSFRFEGEPFDIPVLSVGNDTEIELILYPNPSDDYIIVQSKEASTLSFYGLDGKLVARHWLTIGENKIEVSSLTSGSYIAKFQARSGKVSSKHVIINR